jgi:hypothetical protein
MIQTVEYAPAIEMRYFDMTDEEILEDYTK